MEGSSEHFEKRKEVGGGVGGGLKGGEGEGWCFGLNNRGRKGVVVGFGFKKMSWFKFIMGWRFWPWGVGNAPRK